MTTKEATVRTVPLWRDKAGYEIRDYGAAPHDVAQWAAFGRCIEGRSGELVPVVYSIATGVRGKLWRGASRQLRGVRTIDDLCDFMTVFGPIDLDAGMPFGPGGADPRQYGLDCVKLRRPQSLAQVFADRCISNIAALQAYSMDDDDAGFLSALGGELATRAVLRPMPGALWVTELPSMFALLKYDMWSRFGEGRASTPARRKCANCGTTIHVGGGRQRGMPVTARFCSSKCRVGSHLRQKRYEASARSVRP